MNHLLLVLLLYLIVRKSHKLLTMLGPLNTRPYCLLCLLYTLVWYLYLSILFLLCVVSRLCYCFVLSFDFIFARYHFLIYLCFVFYVFCCSLCLDCLPCRLCIYFSLFLTSLNFIFTLYIICFVARLVLMAFNAWKY